ncbi:MAG: GGDEF domain-containing protein [Lachnospiraceae bacterium]|nr:GGDEF domain-containing protein [Lachnospiraceae bacterium]
MRMTVELFDSIINTSQDCVFWKDKDRRFLGVNQAFLDFYGFESADVLIGKTDEDMGWHSDPEPFKQDELMVLSGNSTYKVHGKCFIRGEERDIIASKRPLYDGDKVVGLVGSFVDVTDVLKRKRGNEDGQVMYPIAKLRKYPFFDRLVDEVSLEEILDSLTGILSRTYVLKFVNSLIMERQPFTFAMIDLDNFKFINDTFGHASGDKVLTTVSKGLAEYTDGFGLVGRFGGDELLLIDLEHTSKEDSTAFFEKLYEDSSVLRVNMEFENGTAYITGTTGCASFPEDADNFADLFGMTDKMLYIGKNKGRNCFTVYDEARHSDIEIANLARRGIFTEMYALRQAFEEVDGLENKLLAVMPFITESLKIRDLFFVGEDGRMKAVIDLSFDEDASDIGKFMDRDVFSENGIEVVQDRAPVFYKALKSNGFQSALVARIRHRSKVYGYLVCAVKRSLRIWQENECAVLYYLAELLVDELRRF